MAGNVVMEVTLGNCHVKFCDDCVIHDEEEIKKRIRRAEEIIYNALPKTEKRK